MLVYFELGLAVLLLMSHCVVPENIHTTPKERICRMTPLPSGFSNIGPQNLPPPHLPSGIFKIFAHPLEILLSLIEVIDKFCIRHAERKRKKSGRQSNK